MNLDRPTPAEQKQAIGYIKPIVAKHAQRLTAKLNSPPSFRPSDNPQHPGSMVPANKTANELTMALYWQSLEKLRAEMGVSGDILRGKADVNFCRLIELATYEVALQNDWIKAAPEPAAEPAPGPS